MVVETYLVVVVVVVAWRGRAAQQPRQVLPSGRILVLLVVVAGITAVSVRGGDRSHSRCSSEIASRLPTHRHVRVTVLGPVQQRSAVFFLSRFEFSLTLTLSPLGVLCAKASSEFTADASIAGARSWLLTSPAAGVS